MLTVSVGTSLASTLVGRKAIAAMPIISTPASRMIRFMTSPCFAYENRPVLMQEAQHFHYGDDAEAESQGHDRHGQGRAKALRPLSEIRRQQLAVDKQEN